MKQQQAKDFKKKKSQDSFFNRLKVQPAKEPHSKYLCARKSHPKLHSLLDHPLSAKDQLYSKEHLSTKEHKKRVNSLQLGPNDVSLGEQMKGSKGGSTGKMKNSIGHCYSDRNVSLVTDPSKLFKYRKFSSNAELPQDEAYSSLPLKEKISRMDEDKGRPKKPLANPAAKYPLTTWLILIRRIYLQHYNQLSTPSLLLPLLLEFLNKVQPQEFQLLSQIVEPIPNFEAELTKDQILTVVSKYFNGPSDKSRGEDKSRRKERHRVSYVQIVDCLVKFLNKCSNSISAAQIKPCSSDDHEEVVETARFQDNNNANDELKKNKKIMAHPPVSFLDMTGQVSESESGKTSQLGSQQRKSSLASKHKPSILACLSPFNMNDAKSNNQSSSSLPQFDSESLIFKKGSFHCQSKEELGMLTLQGKSPRELMESEIFQSIQKLGVSCPRSNMSFSLEHLDVEPHLSFEQSVRSFEEFLKRIKNIQTNYKQRLSSSNDSKELIAEEQVSEEVNAFLQQLINYRIAVNHTQVDQTYTYLVSFEDVLEFKEQNMKIMSVILQTAYIRQYFSALQGLKFENSSFLYQKVEPLLHQDLKVLNLNNNGLQNIDALISNMGESSNLQFININFNLFTDVCPIINSFSRLKELHAKSNHISKVQGSLTKNKQLKIIELAYNQIAAQSDVAALKYCLQLQILNLVGNPLVKAKDWRANWKQTISMKIIYQMQTLYVMSCFGHQKDIAFSARMEREKKNQKRKECTGKSKKLGSQLQQVLRFEQGKANKENQRQQQWMNDECNLIRDEKQMPKQRISKIKTFLDGRVV